MCDSSENGNSFRMDCGLRHFLCSLIFVKTIRDKAISLERGICQEKRGCYCTRASQAGTPSENHAGERNSEVSCKGRVYLSFIFLRFYELSVTKILWPENRHTRRNGP